MKRGWWIAVVVLAALGTVASACKKSDPGESALLVDAGAPAAAAAPAPAPAASTRSLRRPPSPVSGVSREFGRRNGSASSACNGAPAGPSAFGLYVLALSWAPELCNRHSEKEECSPISDFAATHLTLHGLWPNYDDGEAAKSGCDYPQYCGDAARCAKYDVSDACSLDRNAIPAEMKIYGPGYVGDDDFLAAHEWPKHGSCTGLSEPSYFEAALAAMKALGGD